MKHRIKKGRSLSRDLDHRKQLLRNLLTSLLEHKKIETTVAKGKELRREFDKLVNLAKRSEAKNNFSLKRKIFSLLTTKDSAHKLFDYVLPALADRGSGYLTFERSGRMRDDAAETAILEFVNKVDYDKKITKEPGALAPTRRQPGAAREAGRKNS